MDHGQGQPYGDVVRRVQCEFLEMPGLRLTEAQARRLWDLAGSECARVLATLVETGFLFRTRDGAFMRIDRATPAKADVAASPVLRAKFSAA
jgi:hypothetical protein